MHEFGLAHGNSQSSAIHFTSCLPTEAAYLEVLLITSPYPSNLLRSEIVIPEGQDLGWDVLKLTETSQWSTQSVYMARGKNPSVGGSALLRRTPFGCVDTLWEAKEETFSGL